MKSLSEILSEMDRQEQSDRYLHLSYVGWQENEIDGYFAADERGETCNRSNCTR